MEERLRKRSMNVFSAYDLAKDAYHKLRTAQALLQFEPESKCYKAISEACDALGCIDKIHHLVAASILEKDSSSECNHPDDKNSRT